VCSLLVTDKDRQSRTVRETKGGVKANSVASRRRREMKKTQRSRVVATIVVGKWTANVLFLLHEKPYRHVKLRRRLGMIQTSTAVIAAIERDFETAVGQAITE